MIGTQDPAESIFVMPRNGAPLIKVTGFSSFTMTKAAYCFLPSITIKFIANLG
jgi:hypothetical protein